MSIRVIFKDSSVVVYETGIEVQSTQEGVLICVRDSLGTAVATLERIDVEKFETIPDEA